MLNCREATERVSRAMDSDLPWSERLAVRLHLALCSACRNFEKQMALLRRVAQRYPGPGSGTPPPAH